MLSKLAARRAKRSKRLAEVLQAAVTGGGAAPKGDAGSVHAVPLDALTTQIQEIEDQDSEPCLRSRSLRLTDRFLTIELDIRADREVHSRW